MQVEIWSDFICPFCYIGKRKFEMALEQFSKKSSVQVIWKSFQLDPDIPHDTTTINVYDYLAKRKGMSREQSVAAHVNVTEMAKQVGLTYRFDKAIVTHTFDAHRLSHFAKEKGLQEAVEEKLFAAYFTEGKNLSDVQALAQIGASVGLDSKDVLTMLSSDQYTGDVRSDIDEANRLEIRGVPFFVFNRKLGVSGAQDVQTFLKAMENLN